MFGKYSRQVKRNSIFWQWLSANCITHEHPAYGLVISQNAVTSVLEPRQYHLVHFLFVSLCNPDAILKQFYDSFKNISFLEKKCFAFVKKIFLTFANHQLRREKTFVPHFPSPRLRASAFKKQLPQPNPKWGCASRIGKSQLPLAVPIQKC